jgi:two-component system CheB/CheR fusion protein
LEIRMAEDGSEPVADTGALLGQVDTSFFIIGVGASAGGLDAIKHMIREIPPDFPHTLVIVQHMSPDYKSLMAELLSRETTLSVCEVENGMEVQPRHIYLIPPKSNLIIQGTEPADSSLRLEAEADGAVRAKPRRQANVGLRFALIEQSPRPTLNLPIDIFFQSLADAVGDRAVAVVLSGTGSDGSRGLRAVKDAEGFVLVQDPSTAAFDGMPVAAVATKIVDVIAPAGAIVGELDRFFRLRLKDAPDVEQMLDAAPATLEDLLRLASESAEIDFSKYKSPTLKRRIARRMGLIGMTSLDDYVEMVRKDGGERARLHREFLVGVTDFFRDRPVWEYLSQGVLEDLFARGDPQTPLKVWSVGCSTGEEAYSVAMLLEDYRHRHGLTRDFKVLATDVSQGALKVAKAGIYSDRSLQDIPEDFRHSFISYHGGTLSVSPAIRRKVIFSAHNVIDDTPYVNTDLILCRNVLIYLAPQVQARVLALFSFSLLPGAVLVLGASESIDRAADRFAPIDGRLRIYRNVRTRDHTALGARTRSEFFPPSYVPNRMRRIAARSTGEQSERSLSAIRGALESVDLVVLIVTESFEILETFGDYLGFLSMPEAAFSANLLDLAPERLRSAVAMLVRSAANDGAAEQHGVKSPRGAGFDVINLFCKRVEWDAGAVAYAVTLQRQAVITPTARDADADVVIDAGEDRSRYVLELETELEEVRSVLGASLEDLAVTNEELQTSNEELMASNEELQATNEELQSVNEELHTVNAENNERIDDLELAKSDIENILENTHVATMLLDSELRIRRFSSSFKQLFDVDARDHGRPLSSFASMFAYPERQQLLDDAAEVLGSGNEREHEVRAPTGEWYMARSRPFRTNAGGVDGVVMTLYDITQVKALQEDLRAALGRVEGVLESQTAGYWDLNVATGEMYLSPRFKAMFGFAADELPNRLDAVMALVEPEDRARKRHAMETHFQTRGVKPYDVELRCRRKDGARLWINSRGKVSEWGADGEPLRMMGCHIDITQLKEREARTLREAEEIRRFAFISAHDLREPLHGVEACLGALNEDLGDRFDRDQRELMDMALQRMERMKARIAGVLDYARFADHEIAPERVDMTAIFRSALDDLARRQAEAGSEARFDIEDLPPARGAPVLLTRVAYNLLSNALKFRSDARPLQVTVSGAPLDDGGARYTVTDNGIGVSEEDREKVFGIFTRLHTQREFSGDGLGLSLCNRIVDRHGGRIWMDAAPGGGVAVSFTLPAPAAKEGTSP